MAGVRSAQKIKRDNFETEKTESNHLQEQTGKNLYPCIQDIIAYIWVLAVILPNRLHKF